MAHLIRLEILFAEWKRTKSTRRQKQIEEEVKALRNAILRGGK